MLVMPAPIAASVSARSGASNNSQIIDIIILYDIKIITAEITLRVKETAKAQPIRKISSIYSNNIKSNKIITHLVIAGSTRNLSIIHSQSLRARPTVIAG